jgi:hypothetical protein
MEFKPEELKKWWDKISPEDQARIMNRNNAFNFLFKDKSNNIINYESMSRTEESIKPPPNALSESERYK